MSHTLYTTEGFVLGSVNTGEAHRYISIFTKDIGLVRGVARSVREERSKLRYSLQDFSYSNVSLVRGRDVWRITGAKDHYNVYQELKGEKEKILILTQVFSLLKRLLHGEEKNAQLFTILVNGISFLRGGTISKDMLSVLEHVIVLRILHALGYIRETNDLEGLLALPDISEEKLTHVSHLRRPMAMQINRALRESHL